MYCRSAAQVICPPRIFSAARGKREPSLRRGLMVRQRGYAICTQPRSGSNLLCQVLSSTDQLGYPLEYFNGPGRRALGLPDFPDAPELQVKAILRLGMTPNGVYGVKLFASQFAAFSARLRWT